MLYTIKVRIKEILDADDRTIAYLADKTGLNYSALYKLVDNRTRSISFDTLERIATFLDVPIGDLFEIVPDDDEKE